MELTIISLILAAVGSVAIPVLGFILQGIKRNIEKLWGAKDELEEKLQCHEKDRSLHPGEAQLQNLKELFETKLNHLQQGMDEIKKMIEAKK